jgi:formylglycine-generating enzyme
MPSPQRLNRFVPTILLIFIAFHYQQACWSQAAPDVRIVSAKPNSGYFVESSRGYLIPFKETIPGTDVEFEMLPVPGVVGKDGSVGKPFWIGKCEVTFREYREYAKLGLVFQHNRNTSKLVMQDIDAVTAPTEIYDLSYQFGEVESVDCPAFSMTLYSAKQYSKWLSISVNRSYRLPTDAEWQHACVAGGKSNLKESTDKPELFAIFGNSTENVAPVGFKQPNAWGIHDMYGNASEWVLTIFPGDKVESSTEFSPPWVNKGGNYRSSLSRLTAKHQEIANDDYWMEDFDAPVSCSWLANNNIAVGFRLVCQMDALDKQAMQPFWDFESPMVANWVNTRVRSGRLSFGKIDAELPAKAKSVNSKELWKRIPALGK